MKLNSSDEWDSGDGAATIQWPSLRSYPPLLARHQKFEELVQTIAAPAPGPCPARCGGCCRKSSTICSARATGPLLTVHPLGGCPMGDDATGGVVDDCGRVFDASGSGNSPYHEGLVVLDGSIVPASLGINPALTIASLALRAIAVLRKDWGYTEERAGGSIGNRPYFKRPGPVEPAKDTLIEVIERLSGPVAIAGMEHEGDSHVELTMRFDPVSIKDLVSGNRRRHTPTAAWQRALARLCGSPARRQGSCGRGRAPGCFGCGHAAGLQPREVIASRAQAARMVGMVAQPGSAGQRALDHRQVQGRRAGADS